MPLLLFVTLQFFFADRHPEHHTNKQPNKFALAESHNTTKGTRRTPVTRRRWRCCSHRRRSPCLPRRRRLVRTCVFDFVSFRFECVTLCLFDSPTVFLLCRCCCCVSAHCDARKARRRRRHCLSYRCARGYVVALSIMLLRFAIRFGWILNTSLVHRYIRSISTHHHHHHHPPRMIRTQVTLLASRSCSPSRRRRRCSARRTRSKVRWRIYRCVWRVFCVLFLCLDFDSFCHAFHECTLTQSRIRVRVETPRDIAVAAQKRKPDE